MFKKGFEKVVSKDLDLLSDTRYDTDQAEGILYEAFVLPAQNEKDDNEVSDICSRN